MSLSKGMTFEDIKPHVSKGIGKKVALRELDSYNTSTLLWYVAKRHKFGLVLTTLIVYVTFNMFGTLIVGLAESIK